MLIGLIPQNLGSGGGPQILRMLRLLRLARMMRLLRSVPELLTLVKGMQILTTKNAKMEDQLDDEKKSQKEKITSQKMAKIVEKQRKMLEKAGVLKKKKKKVIRIKIQKAMKTK